MALREAAVVVDEVVARCNGMEVTQSYSWNEGFGGMDGLALTLTRRHDSQQFCSRRVGAEYESKANFSSSRRDTLNGSSSSTEPEPVEEST